MLRLFPSHDPGGGSWTESLTAGDRVLVKDQTNATENGVYTAFASGWRRATDFNGYRDVVKGTSVPIESTGDRYRVITENPILLGTSEINFQLHPQDARVIPVTSRTAMKAYNVPPGTQFGFDGHIWEVKSGTPPSDPREGIYVVLDNGNYAERTGYDAVYISFFDAAEDGVTDDNAAIVAALSLNVGGVTKCSRGATVVSKSAIEMPDGSRLDLNKSTLRFEVDGDTKDLVVGSNSWVVNGTVENAGTGSISAGQFQCPVLVGSYADGTGLLIVTGKHW